MIRVVLDTSVVVSAVISPFGPNAQVVDLVIADQLRLFVTPAVLEEYGRVFKYERLQHLDRRRVGNVLRLPKQAATTVKSPGRLKVSEHEEDNRSYECALAAKAHYILTENTRHFRKSHSSTKIITARQFLQTLENSTRQFS